MSVAQLGTLPGQWYQRYGNGCNCAAEEAVAKRRYRVYGMSVTLLGTLCRCQISSGLMQSVKAIAVASMVDCRGYRQELSLRANTKAEDSVAEDKEQRNLQGVLRSRDCIRRIVNMRFASWRELYCNSIDKISESSSNGAIAIGTVVRIGKAK